jgi:hypothetical protein
MEIGQGPNWGCSVKEEKSDFEYAAILQMKGKQERAELDQFNAERGVVRKVRSSSG